MISGKPINEEIARGGPFVMNTKNAEIIAAVSLPSFSPNIYNNFSPTINQITAAVFELGSIFKSFTIASSLNEDQIKIENTYDVTKPLILNNKKIRATIDIDINTNSMNNFSKPIYLGDTVLEFKFDPIL